MIAHDMPQGSTAWHALRCGLPTASEFHELITPAWKLKGSQGREDYVLQKVADKIMGFTPESLNSFAMGQGTILESEAIPWYEGVFDIPVQRVGFCTTDDGRIGCSPDGLIGDDNGLEIKCPTPHVHLGYLMAGGVPREYLAQVHGGMLITGRPRWTFVSYNRHFPAHIVHVDRDDAIQAALHAAIAKFLEDFDAAHAQITAMMPQGGRADL